MLAGLCTISTKRWRRVRIDTRDHSKMSERPPAWSASAATVPLNCDGSFGRRTMIRVPYGASFAVPVTKYSSVRYGKSSTRAAPGTTLTAGSGYILAGPATGPEIAGTGGTFDGAWANGCDASAVSASTTKRGWRLMEPPGGLKSALYIALPA